MEETDTAEREYIERFSNNYGKRSTAQLVQPIQRERQNETLAEREKTHGNYSKTAAIAQELKATINHCDGGLLSSVQAESLDLICTKISRILSGNPNEPDHWRDIAGYASLVVEALANE